jgi:DNA-binding response OmpR family regulator
MPSDVQCAPRASAPTDASIRELGGISTPDDLRRNVSVDGTVILATTGTSDDVALVQQLAAEQGWPLAQVDNVDAAAWAANIQKVSLVIAAGDDPAFVLDVVKAVRRATTAPAISLGLSDAHDRVRTMVEGADVALPPGMAMAELRAQLVALLRRSGETWEPAVRYLAAGHLLVDLWSRDCAVAGEPVDLTPLEFQLLVYLMQHPRQSLSSQKIVQKVWQNWGYTSGLNTLRIHVSRLRQKLGVHPEASDYIRSVRRFGYEFRHNVVQVGDGANKVASDSPGDLKLAAVLLDIARMLQTRSTDEAAGSILELLVESVGSDAASLFQRRGERMFLVAEQGCSEWFRKTVEGGTPITAGYAQAGAVRLAEPIQLASISTVGRQYPDSAEIMAHDGFRTCLFLPIITEQGTWCLGLASRSSRPFGATATTFCSAVASLLTLQTAQIGRPAPIDQSSETAGPRPPVSRRA